MNIRTAMQAYDTALAAWERSPTDANADACRVALDALRIARELANERQRTDSLVCKQIQGRRS